jgi:hypothetical protein
MTPQEILAKCAEHNVKMRVIDGKLTPVGGVSLDFLKISASFIPYKAELIKYIEENHPEMVGHPVKPSSAYTNPVPVPNTINVKGTANEKIQRLRVPCIHLGPPIEKASSCGCNGAVTHKCNLFEKCRRAGDYSDIAICTSCDKYEPVV